MEGFLSVSQRVAMAAEMVTAKLGGYRRKDILSPERFNETTLQDAADRMGVGKSSVANYMPVYRGYPHLHAAVKAGALKASKARALIRGLLVAGEEEWGNGLWLGQFGYAGVG